MTLKISKDVCYNVLFSLFDSEDEENFSQVTKKIGIAFFTYKYKTLEIRRLEKNQQVMVRQVFSIIEKSRFSEWKKYLCLRSLRAGIGQLPPRRWCGPYGRATRLYFARLATADIPFFILTRCWSILMNPKIASNFNDVTELGPITSKSFNALIQAYSNTLLVTSQDYHSIPRTIQIASNDLRILNIATRDAYIPNRSISTRLAAEKASYMISSATES